MNSSKELADSTVVSSTDDFKKSLRPRRSAEKKETDAFNSTKREKKNKSVRKTHNKRKITRNNKRATSEDVFAETCSSSSSQSSDAVATSTTDEDAMRRRRMAEQRLVKVMQDDSSGIRCLKRLPDYLINYEPGQPPLVPTKILRTLSWRVKR